jgi:putative glycerol-1-phosphate prenyltransferase
MFLPLREGTQLAKKKGLKQCALLIDPDKAADGYLEGLAQQADRARPDYLLVGGSLLTEGAMAPALEKCRSLFPQCPLVLFPGNTLHIHPAADAVLFLSLISGRNPEYLIGQQVQAAPLLRKTRLEVVPTGYMLVDCGKTTTAHYMSNTLPIPYDKPELAACTALAGQLLGMHLVYLDGGSGAPKPVAPAMIAQVAQWLEIPLWVGGGIREADQAATAYQAGADCLVIGTAVENQTDTLSAICAVRDGFNQL